MEFHGSESEWTLYTKVNEKCNMLIVCLYVYDLIFIGYIGLKDFRIVMESEFEMIDLVLMIFFWSLNSTNLKVVYLYHSPSMQVQF